MGNAPFVRELSLTEWQHPSFAPGGWYHNFNDSYEMAGESDRKRVP